MATSLAEQLKRLAVPQSSIYKDEKKKASLLFDPKQAALKDRETFYEIGVSGLKELITLNDNFRFYEDSLFSLSSKDFERAVQSKDLNQNLDKTIEKFLLQLSPYLLLEPAHKALEWLVNRYHIHEYNQDAIMALILPYHETKIFIRFIQMLDLKATSNRWNWLEPLQKPGIPLSNQVLFNQCTSNPATLKFIANIILKHSKEFRDLSQLNTVFAFFCSTAIGVINTCKKVTENIINALLPTVMAGLESPVEQFRAVSNIIIGFLCTKTTLNTKTFNEIVEKVLIIDFDLPEDNVMLITIMYKNQKHITKINDSILYNFTDNTISNICAHLKNLKCSIRDFVQVFLTSVLAVIQNDSDDFRRFSRFPEIMIDEVNLKYSQPDKIIKCIIDVYKITNSDEKQNEDESDIELVDDEDFSCKIMQWYSQLLKSMEQKYPEAFDKVIKEEFNTKCKNTSKKHLQLTKILRFKPAIAHKIGNAYLFENLNHLNPGCRVQAVNYIRKEFKTLQNENIDFVKESIINRFFDEDTDVVLAVLAIPNNYLKEVLNEIELTSVLKYIVSKDSKQWNTVIKEAISKISSLEMLPLNQETVLALVPHLFPYDESSAEIAYEIIRSIWGKKFGLTKVMKDIDKSQCTDYNILNKAAFRALFKNEDINFDELLDINQLNKSSCIDICIYLLLKSCSLKNSTVEDVIDILNLILDSVETRQVMSSTNKSFCHLIMPEFIAAAKQDTILFEVMEYIFIKIIETIEICDITKSWCNILRTPGTILVRRLFEICITGCSINSYENNYTKLLHKLLDKLFKNAKEKFEFIINFACGHILYATDPKDVISPELQLRSLKLIHKFIETKNNLKWLYECDALILLIIFNLNNPIAIIRQYTVDIIETLLNNERDKKNTYVQLLYELLTHKQELLLDYEQISQVLNIILTQSAPQKKVFQKNCLLKLMDIFSSNTHAHVTSKFLEIFSTFNNANVFTKILPSLKTFEHQWKENYINPKVVFDIYESKLIKNVYNRIDESTVSTFNKDFIWDSISLGLKEYKECILEEDQSLVSPSVLIMKQINENVFNLIPEQRRQELVCLITSAGTFSNNPTISSIASKVMKRIHLKFQDFKSLLENMLNVQDSDSKMLKKKKATTISMLSYQVAEKIEWKLGVTLLEYVQTKKKLSVDNGFVLILFQLLNKCLSFEEQSYVEYTKQLILSSLWYYCRKFVDDKDSEQIKSMFYIELIVKCIRGTQNPQTHHHALILLSHAAYMLPEQVLHHTMEVFTFMGTSVLRHDDAYSFQIITKIIETLIPILVKLEKKVDSHNEFELEQLKKRVVPVLRIFADVVLYVPEHRRLPLYKKLLETVGPNQFLWVFLALLLETHIVHFNDEKEKQNNKMLADREIPMNRLDFGQNILLEFPPEICFENFVKLMVYVKSLPLQKEENSMDTNIDSTDIFSVNGHTAIQLRHYKYIIITFMNTCLASSRFIQHNSQAKHANVMENYYKSFIVNILTFIQSISKLSDEKTAKYWRVMLHHSYDLLNHTNNLLSAPIFCSVIRGLLNHTLHTVRRKSMELLNSKIQINPEMFEDVPRDLLYSLLPALSDIVKLSNCKIDNLNESAAQELELNQQTALLSLKLLTRMLASEDPEPFKPVLEMITEYTCNLNNSDNVMASVVLCLAELCSNLKAHALVSLRKFMPALIKVLKKQRKADTPELVLLSTVTTISKIVESLPLFLSPYLQKILYEYSLLLAKWESSDQDCNKVSSIVTKLINIKKKIATSIPPRVLIPVASETHQLLLEKENFVAIGPVMSVLAESFANLTTADFTALREDLTSLFLTALQLRCDTTEKNIDKLIIDTAEDEVVNALVCLVLKLSETSFRPLYFKIYDWAIRANIKIRIITFYRLSAALADKLKGLFVLFAGHFMKNASDLLDACNNSKNEELYFTNEENCITLIKYIIKTLHIVFLYDSQHFINKDRFETLMQPIVDQLENTVAGIDNLKSRAAEYLIPCISQFAVATADDSLWKLLNYQILLKTRHNDATIRLVAVDCLVAMATQLGSSWLPLLAESVPFFAELLEDGDSKIELATKDAIRKLEQILGESLDKYF